MMTQTLRRSPKVAVLLVLLGATQLAAQAQKPASKKPVAPAAPVTRDLTGMYTFLQEGEFVQITVAREEDSLVAARQYGTSPTPKEATATDRSTGKTIQMTYDPPALEKTAGSIHKPRVVTGFISRFGDLESDKGAFLDHFFTKGSLYGDEISFTTKQIHGVWYAFKGKVERGMEVKAPAEEGYYVIRGRLQRLSTDTNKKTSAQEREVVLKSFPDLDADAESGKKN